jgi:hypothetical protein
VPSVEYDLRYFSAGLSELEDYLHAQELYCPLGVLPPAGEPPYPSLTLGNLLLVRARLRARAVSYDLSLKLDGLDHQMETTRTRWLRAWGQKASREFRARLSLWRDYLEDYRQDPDGNTDRYAYEIHRRVELELLKADTDSIPSQELDVLEGLDKLLQSVFLPGKFAWDLELRDGFTQDTYWYLYGYPKGS